MYSILMLPWSIIYDISALSLRSTKSVDMQYDEVWRWNEVERIHE